MDGKRNIVIVGGGIIGSTTAYFLTRHPKFSPALHTVTLLEAAPTLAAGASGKAGGLLAQWAYPSCLVPLSYRLHADLAAEHNGVQRWGYRHVQCGSIEAAVSKDRIDGQKLAGDGIGDAQKKWEKLPKQDDAAKDLLDPRTGMPRDLDWIDVDVVQAYAEMGSPGAAETSQVHPLHFTKSMGELAGAAGVEIRTNAKVTKLRTSATGVEGVEYLDRNTGETREMSHVTDIVVAAGPWTGRVLPRSKVEGLRAHSVVYEADVSAYAVFTDISLPTDFVPEHRAKMGQSRRHRGNVDPEMYARPFGEVYACGEPDTTVPLPETADLVQVEQAQCDDIIAYIGTISPILGAAPIKAKQACYLPQHIRFGHESGPLIGKTAIPGLFVAAGHTCWGIQNGPGTGKLMSEFVFDGEAKSANISKLDPRKFKVNKKETLAQNYRRLGLAARLRGPTGGTEKLLSSSKEAGASGRPAKRSDVDPFAIAPTNQKAVLGEAKVERDASGRIVRVIRPGSGNDANPLNDPLNEYDSDSDDGTGAKKKGAKIDNGVANYEEWGGIREQGDETDVVRTLMDEARNPAEKKPRYQSSREREWLTSLVDKHGDDVTAMARDRKLNPMQQTAADIARRLKKLRKE
ncbi:FAD dependent oxidoreductase [Geosmithia morbida]|uniref:FAD dependent oxidoreductase n=1 Tax=Geosmithia morbida TaxID=1094350 RepID=A0A9P4YTQ9_9HYPO|nr:FAD dependent oxidoreductase [Geosmithia morbida]KAF4120854.1 FAD dependent oxidoreductase [Geosmithia morbida]